MRRVVIVGAGLAGLRSAEALRRGGFDGELILVGDEGRRPYDRPPLSKAFLAGERDDETLELARDWDGLGLDARLGAAAVSFDVERRIVRLDDGDEVAGDGIVVATGCQARNLTGQPASVTTLRTVADARRLRDRMESARSLAVIGGGFIGAEVAATARQRGLAVTIIEMASHLLARALGPELGGVVGQIHRSHGVDVMTGSALVEMTEVEGGATRLTVEGPDGARRDLTADIVVVGVGARPTTDWLEGSGLTIDDGVVTDATLMAAPGVVAAGDVARYPSQRIGRSVRVEHWTHAAESGLAAGARLLATDESAAVYDPVPYVWSDQFDDTVMIAGWPSPDGAVEILVGDAEAGRFLAVIHAPGGPEADVVGFAALNMAPALTRARLALAEPMTLSEARDRFAS